MKNFLTSLDLLPCLLVSQNVPRSRVSVDMPSDLLARLGYIMGDQSLQRPCCTGRMEFGASTRGAHILLYQGHRYTVKNGVLHYTPGALEYTGY